MYIVQPVGVGLQKRGAGGAGTWRMRMAPPRVRRANAHQTASNQSAIYHTHKAITHASGSTVTILSVRPVLLGVKRTAAKGAHKTQPYYTTGARVQERTGTTPKQRFECERPRGAGGAAEVASETPHRASLGHHTLSRCRRDSSSVAALQPMTDTCGHEHTAPLKRHNAPTPPP